MPALLRVLVLEDRPEDSELMLRELRRAGFELLSERVETEADFLARLTPPPDLILADYSLPQFTALRALNGLQRRQLDIPLIVVTGSISEEAAVACILHGAADYLLKDRLARLGQAAIRALEQKRLRVETRAAEQRLRESERRFRALIEKSTDAVAMIGADGTILYQSPAATKILGYTADELVALNAFDLLHPEDAPLNRALFAQLLQTPEASATGQFRYRHKDSSWRWVEATGTNLLAEPAVQAIVVNYRDITERKEAEERLRLSDEILQRVGAVVLVANEEGHIVYASPAVEAILDYAPADLLGDGWWRLTRSDPAQRELEREMVARQARGEVPFSDEPYEREIWDRAGAPHWILWQDAKGPDGLLIGVGQDITERKQHEHERAAIVALAAALRTAQTRAELLPVILDQTLGLFEAHGAALVMRDTHTQDTVVELGRGGWANLTGMHIPAGEGITGHVIATGQPHLTNEAHSDRRVYWTGWLGDIQAAACAPLLAQEQTIGALWVGRRASILESELRLLSAIADMAANAIHRAQLHEQTERSLQRLAALRSIDMAITASLDLRMTLNILLDQVTEQLRVDAAGILLLNPHMQTLEFAAGRGFHGKDIERSQLRLGQGHAGRAALERRLVNVADLAQTGNEFVRYALLTGENFVSYYGMPLIAKGQVKGVLDIFHRARLDPDPDWLNFLEALAGQAAIAIDNAELFDSLQRSNVELALAYDTTLEGWSKALDLRDKETEGHTQRVTEMTLRLARALGLRDADPVHLRRGALLHDIGKMGIPDSILLKPGPLTDEEWAIMRQHPVYAYELLSPIAFLRPALDIPYCHHEKWDGTGYPRGLQGEQIPLAARIFAVVDVWDALGSDRPYRPAWAPAQIGAYLREQAGRHFDPRAVEAFFRVLEEQDE